MVTYRQPIALYNKAVVHYHITKQGLEMQCKQMSLIPGILVVKEFIISSNAI